MRLVSGWVGCVRWMLLFYCWGEVKSPIVRVTVCWSVPFVFFFRVADRPTLDRAPPHRFAGGPGTFFVRWFVAARIALAPLLCP